MRRPARRYFVPGAWACAVLAACGGGESTAPRDDVVSVEVTPTASLAVGVGDTVRFVASPKDANGRPVPGARVAWRAADGGVATLGADGLATAVAAGTTGVTATVGSVSGSASLEVWVPPSVSAYLPGVSCFGRRGYVEYVPGELPVIISAPHGGSETPAEIPDRTYGTTVTDSNTRETLAAVRQAFLDRTGKAPHVVISHLRRTKLDPNREIVEAAQGSPFAENAWEEFQGFIDLASAQVTETYGSGFYIDLHGHGHAIARAELGYLLSAAQLNGSDAALDAGAAEGQSSIRALSEASPLPFSALLRGPRSLGALLQAEGVASVPSPDDPGPGANEYFTGGYNTERHGSRTPGRAVSGVQIELPFPGIRDNAASRAAFGAAVAAALETYMAEHFGFFRSPP